MSGPEIILATERLILRKVLDADLDNLVLLDSNPEVMEYIGEPRDREFVRNRMKLVFEYYGKHPGLGSFITELKDGTFIGWSAIKHLDQSEEIEIGYRYLPEHWGKGYATEASIALRDYGFNTLALTRLVGVTNPANTGSQRVLEKTGMTYEKDAHFYNQPVRYFAIDR